MSGQQSSVGLGRRHQLHRPGQPAFPAASPSPQEPTDDCSPLTARSRPAPARQLAQLSRFSFAHLLLEPPSALRVVAEHVEARAGRREQHHACRLAPARTRARSRRRTTPPRGPSTTSPSASRTSGLRLADRDDRLARAPPAARAAAARSPPLNRPPMIGTRPRSKLSIDRSADSTFVAFESFTNRTPSTLGDELHRVLEAAERVDRGGHRRRRGAGDRADGRRRHARRPPDAARADESRRAARAARVDRAARSTIQPSSTTVPSAIERAAREQPRAARGRGAPARAPPGSSALITAQSPRVLVLEDPRLRRARTPRRSDGDRDGRARNSASPRSTDETCRSAPAESCSSRRRAASRASTSATCALSGAPMLPPTVTLKPAASSIRPVSAVVVDLPFVPVIAITRPCSQRDASSISPMTGTPRVARGLRRPAARAARPG